MSPSDPTTRRMASRSAGACNHSSRRRVGVDHPTQGMLTRGCHKRRYRSRKALLAVISRRNEIQAIVAWMDAQVGPGWKKRMEERDRYMNQNIPPRWVRGSVRPLQRSVERLRAYAARFGYGQISACRNPHPSGQWVDLAKALDRLADLKT